MQIPADVFIKAIETTIETVSNSRPNLNGIKLEVDTDHVRAIATDGHMLNKYEHELTEHDWRNLEDSQKENTGLDMYIDTAGIKPAMSAIKAYMKQYRSLTCLPVTLDIQDKTLILKRLDQTPICTLNRKEDDFPPYEKVIPSYTEDTPASNAVNIDPKYWRSIGTSFMQLGTQAVSIKTSDALSPVLLQGRHDRDRLTVVVMPVRA